MDRVQAVSASHSDQHVEYGFKIRASQLELPSSRPSPIYSRFQNEECTIILNTNPNTHAAYAYLMDQAAERTGQLQLKAELYVIGHEVGHCVYRDFRLKNPSAVNLQFERHEHPGGLSSDGPPAPNVVTADNRHLHEEIFADLYAIEFAKHWLGGNAQGIEDVVVNFRKKVSAHDPKYFTHNYLKSCADPQHSLQEHRVN